MSQCFSNQKTYVNRLGDTTFIIKNNFSGTKTLEDTFEEIIIDSFRTKYSDDNYNKYEDEKISFG